MELQITSSGGLLRPTVMLPASKDSDDIVEALKRSIASLYSPGSPRKQANVPALKNVPLGERLYDARAFCKIKTAAVAMHLDGLDHRLGHVPPTDTELWAVPTLQKLENQQLGLVGWALPTRWWPKR